MTKRRADVLLYERGLVSSREKAKRVIMEGVVYIGTERVDKPGEKIEENSNIYIKKDPIKYVSRGGLKLEKAIEEFNLDLKDKITMDIGASTGGFTDCMLKNKAKKVYTVDVGYGQLDWGLRNDKRVVVMERTNIRHVENKDIDDILDFISIDVSFISLELVLPVAYNLLRDGGEVLALVKPQFEAGRENVGKNGIVRDRKVHNKVLKDIFDFAEKIGFGIYNLSYSPITGAKGNIEFILHLKKNIVSRNIRDNIANLVEQSHRELK